MNLTNYFNSKICNDFAAMCTDSKYITNIVEGIGAEMAANGITYDEYWQEEFPDYIGQDVMEFLRDYKYELLNDSNIDTTWQMLMSELSMNEFINLINANPETVHIIKRVWGVQIISDYDNYNFGIVKTAIEDALDYYIMNEWYDVIEGMYLDFHDKEAQRQGLN